MAEKERIGFIGLGSMGSRMAERILKGGYPLTVYNKSREKTESFVRRGAEAVGTPRDLASRSDTILCSVTDDSAVRAVMLDPDGVLDGTREGATIVNLSTVSPKTSRELAQATRERGASMIDAPVSGSTPQAEQGSLVIFIGGEQESYQRVKPVLDLLGKEIFYMGPSGAGSIMKLVVNTLLGVGLQAIAEAIALGEKAGLSKDRLLDTLGQTAVIAPGHKAKLANVLRDVYPATFGVRLMYKDFGLILDEAAELSVSMPATAVARQMCAAERVKGLEEDYSAVIRLMESLAGLGQTTGP
jgi:3-hydroxyisobutyrate dehydrogenase-like beta-hydroxyacid dehydrogenase